VRRLVALLAGLAILLLVNVVVTQREQLVGSGRVVLLELAPVDPRSLMQGDYMALRFRVATEAFGPGRVAADAADGHLVLRPDEKGVAQFVRLDDGTPLADGEIRMRFRVRGGMPKLATNAFFFEEGSAARYDAARFGEFRVDGNGEAILTGLRDRELRGL
jgi:uncharacterized membrane-anchored protein